MYLKTMNRSSANSGKLSPTNRENLNDDDDVVVLSLIEQLSKETKDADALKRALKERKLELSLQRYKNRSMKQVENSKSSGVFSAKSNKKYDSGSDMMETDTTNSRFSHKKAERSYLDCDVQQALKRSLEDVAMTMHPDRISAVNMYYKKIKSFDPSVQLAIKKSIEDAVIRTRSNYFISNNLSAHQEKFRAKSLCKSQQSFDMEVEAALQKSLLDAANDLSEEDIVTANKLFKLQRSFDSELEEALRKSLEEVTSSCNFPNNLGFSPSFRESASTSKESIENKFSDEKERRTIAESNVYRPITQEDNKLFSKSSSVDIYTRLKATKGLNTREKVTTPAIASVQNAKPRNSPAGGVLTTAASSIVKIFSSSSKQVVTRKKQPTSTLYRPPPVESLIFTDSSKMISVANTSSSLRQSLLVSPQMFEASKNSAYMPIASNHPVLTPISKDSDEKVTLNPSQWTPDAALTEETLLMSNMIQSSSQHESDVIQHDLIKEQRDSDSEDTYGTVVSLDDDFRNDLNLGQIVVSSFKNGQICAVTNENVPFTTSQSSSHYRHHSRTSSRNKSRNFFDAPSFYNSATSVTGTPTTAYLKKSYYFESAASNPFSDEEEHEDLSPLETAEIILHSTLPAVSSINRSGTPIYAHAVVNNNSPVTSYFKESKVSKSPSDHSFEIRLKGTKSSPSIVQSNPRLNELDARNSNLSTSMNSDYDRETHDMSPFASLETCDQPHSVATDRSTIDSNKFHSTLNSTEALTSVLRLLQDALKTSPIQENSIQSATNLLENIILQQHLDTARVGSQDLSNNRYLLSNNYNMITSSDDPEVLRRSSGSSKTNRSILHRRNKYTFIDVETIGSMDDMIPDCKQSLKVPTLIPESGPNSPLFLKIDQNQSSPIQCTITSSPKGFLHQSDCDDNVLLSATTKNRKLNRSDLFENLFSLDDSCKFKGNMSDFGASKVVSGYKTQSVVINGSESSIPTNSSLLPYHATGEKQRSVEHSSSIINRGQDKTSSSSHLLGPTSCSPPRIPHSQQQRESHSILQTNDTTVPSSQDLQPDSSSVCRYSHTYSDIKELKGFNGNTYSSVRNSHDGSQRLDHQNTSSSHQARQQHYNINVLSHKVDDSQAERVDHNHSGAWNQSEDFKSNLITSSMNTDCHPNCFNDFIHHPKQSNPASSLLSPRSCSTMDYHIESNSRRQSAPAPSSIERKKCVPSERSANQPMPPFNAHSYNANEHNASTADKLHISSSYADYQQSSHHGYYESKNQQSPNMKGFSAHHSLQQDFSWLDNNINNNTSQYNRSERVNNSHSATDVLLHRKMTFEQQNPPPPLLSKSPDRYLPHQSSNQTQLFNPHSSYLSQASSPFQSSQLQPPPPQYQLHQNNNNINVNNNNHALNQHISPPRPLFHEIVFDEPLSATSSITEDSSFIENLESALQQDPLLMDFGLSNNGYPFKYSSHHHHGGKMNYTNAKRDTNVYSNNNNNNHNNNHFTDSRSGGFESAQSRLRNGSSRQHLLPLQLQQKQQQKKQQAVHPSGIIRMGDLQRCKSMPSVVSECGWSCSLCTLVNNPTFLICEACGAVRTNVA